MSEPAPPRARRPFDGLKVIDCASFIAAPVAATMLADLGADVIKIEPPEGDPYRRTYLTVGLPASQRNYPWEVDNRNKRAICLDLKRPEASDVMRRLVASADVFITNLPLPVRARLGLSAEMMRACNPRLIYASFTAYGETGPEAGKPGFDATAYWARSGLMDLVKADHGAPPSRPTMGMGDHPSASAFFGAIVTALYDRERTGQGAEVRSSLLVNGLWSNAIMVQGQLNGLQFAPRQPRELAPNPFGNLYCCGDGRWLNLTLSSEEKQFPLLMQALGLHDYAERPKLASLAACREHHRDTIAEFDQRFAQHPLAYWRRELDARGITFGVIGSLADIEDDEQMRVSGALVPFADGEGLTVNSPFDVVGIDKVAPERAPDQGAHNLQVLSELGYVEDEIAALLAMGVLRAGSA
jgi:crotonobetainyl-CoA:carnitine CoA-transferase CaiB-like acyl-CoA transferase